MNGIYYLQLTFHEAYCFIYYIWIMSHRDDWEWEILLHFVYLFIFLILQSGDNKIKLKKQEKFRDPVPSSLLVPWPNNVTTIHNLFTIPASPFIHVTLFHLAVFYLFFFFFSNIDLSSLHRIHCEAETPEVTLFSPHTNAVSNWQLKFWLETLHILIPLSRAVV